MADQKHFRTGFSLEFRRGSWAKEEGRPTEHFPGNAVYHGSVTKEQVDVLEKIVNAFLGGHWLGVELEQWLALQPHLEDHGPLPITHEKMYTEEQMRSAWKAGQDLSRRPETGPLVIALEKARRYVENRGAFCSRWDMLRIIDDALNGAPPEKEAGAPPFVGRRSDDKITPIATLLRTWADNEASKPHDVADLGPNKYLVDLLNDAADEIDRALSRSSIEAHEYAAMADSFELARQHRTEEGKQVDFVEISGEPLAELIRMLREAGAPSTARANNAAPQADTDAGGSPGQRSNAGTEPADAAPTPIEREVIEAAQLYREQIHVRMDTRHPSASPSIESMKYTLRWLFAKMEQRGAFTRSSIGTKNVMALYEGCKCPDEPTRCFSDRVLSAMLGLSSGSATRETIPAVLFDGHAVYTEAAAHAGPDHTLRAHHVSAVLDAAVRLIRRANGAGTAT